MNKWRSTYLYLGLATLTLNFKKKKSKQSLCSHCISSTWRDFWYMVDVQLNVAVVQSLSCIQLFASPWIEACQASLSFTISWSLFKFMSIELVMLSKHLILCWPLFLLPSVFPSIRVFFIEPALCIRWPKYWNFDFSIALSSECARLIFFRIYLLAVQGTLKNLLQHHNSKASILYHSSIFMALIPHS